MKGWVLTGEKVLEEREVTEPVSWAVSPKIKITKTLITLNDLLRYDGELESERVVLGESGIGVVSEAEPNLFDLKKGMRVYVEPNRECGECYNCLNGNKKECSEMRVAGENYNGFLRDFVSAPSEKVFVLPETVSDLDALFINQISLAINAVDKLNVQKGDYVAVIGGNSFGIILSQLLIYYSAVPILITSDDESAEKAKSSGVYYVLGEKDNVIKEVASITGGRMAEKVIYVNESGIPATRAFSLASFGADVALTGVSLKSNSVSLNQAIKKQLDIRCLNHGYGNTGTAINLLINKAINLSFVKPNVCSYENVPDTFKTLSENYKSTGKYTETVVEMV